MIEIMVLGTFHFKKLGLDLCETDYVLNQSDVSEVIDSLKKFNCTKIALESAQKNEGIMSDRYQKFLNDDFEISENEIYQLGFKLAKEMSHKDIYSVDWNQMLKDSLGFGDVIDKMAESKKEVIDQLIDDSKSTSIIGKLANEHSLKLALRTLNTEENIKKQSWLNDRLILLNNKGEYVGNRWLMYWHYRNLNIVSNILNTVSDGDRLLVIYGASHSKILKYLLDQNPNIKLVDPLDYL